MALHIIFRIFKHGPAFYLHLDVFQVSVAPPE